jgi:hypothetical protein
LSDIGGETTMPTFSDNSERRCETRSIRRFGCAFASPLAIPSVRSMADRSALDRRVSPVR